MQKIIIDINGMMPSENKLMRMHWAEKKKLREKFYWLFLEGLNKSEGYRKYEKILPFKRCEIYYIFFKKYLLDNENLHTKMLTDFLTPPIGRKIYGFGIIEQDNPKCIFNLHKIQKKIKKGEEEKIRIIIENLEEVENE